MDTDPAGSHLVLVVEDDDAIADSLMVELRSQGYRVERAANGQEALDLARTLQVDAVLLDLGLPDLDGVHVCRQIRQQSPSIPIIMLTARDAEIDVVVGLDAGATDYVTKPFSVHVLLARLRAHLRTAAGAAPAGVLQFDELQIDPDALQAFRAGVEIDLRPKEVLLLIKLASSAGRVLSREQLLEDVWGMDWTTSTNTLEVHMHALRHKLGERSDGREWISTIRSLGYRFNK